MTDLPFNNANAGVKVTVTVPSGWEWRVVHPTTIEDMHTAIGRISQDLNNGDITRYGGISLTCTLNNQIAVKRHIDESPMLFSPPTEESIPHTFRFAMGYVRGLLALPGEAIGRDSPAQIAFDDILSRWLGKNVPVVAARTAAAALKPGA
jgi:hypothetical protein